jgi:probable F420-dependent oxidoreductase
MEIGCHLPTQGPLATPEALETFARQAEAHRMASLWVSDHVVFPKANSSQYPAGRFPYAPDTPYLEPVAVLAAASMCTQRARLGSSVFILGHRNPIVMAKMLTTIDTLSKGRLICGVGVGWWAEEFAALGVPFKSRGRQADEMIKIFKELWTADEPQFQGEFFRFANIGFAPKPVQKPHPPIWVGGHSLAALRRAVALGDGWHGTQQRPEDLQGTLDRLRQEADKAGRPFDTLELSLRIPLRAEALQGSHQAIIDQYSACKQLGLSHLVVDFRRHDLAQMLETLDCMATEIRPAVEAA